MFEIIEKELNNRNIKYFKLTGSTKVDERIELVDEFNQNKEISVFLISLKAGGTGQMCIRDSYRGTKRCSTFSRT